MTRWLRRPLASIGPLLALACGDIAEGYGSLAELADVSHCALSGTYVLEVEPEPGEECEPQSWRLEAADGERGPCDFRASAFGLALGIMECEPGDPVLVCRAESVMLNGCWGSAWLHREEES